MRPLVLLVNTIATGAALVALILTFGPISGAHLNPAVTLVNAFENNLPWREAAGYAASQCLGGATGAVIANLMFALPLYSFSTHNRHGWPIILSEFVATFGLMSVILGCVRRRPSAVPFAVAAYIISAYWFTASTSFANPAVTIARTFSDTFAGIRTADTPLFVVAQISGALAATLVFRYFIPDVASV